MNKPNDIITEHYLTNYERLVKRSTNRVPNKSVALAEECVQEAYTRALKYFNTFNPKKDKFEKWFEGILRNAINDCRNVEKDRGVSKELADEDGVELIPSRKEKIGAIFILAKMKKDINHRVLSLFLLYGYKTKDIAEYTGVSHTSVRQIIHRWRANMYEILNISK
jgi:RNA polymerase sigma factor (sigma-70 family)